MNKKQDKLLNQSKLCELKVSDSLTNLEEFTRIVTDDIDFNCFDVLSITRIDCDEPYTRNFAHPHVEANAQEIALEISDTPPSEIARNKLN